MIPPMSILLVLSFTIAKLPRIRWDWGSYFASLQRSKSLYFNFVFSHAQVEYSSAHSFSSTPLCQGTHLSLTAPLCTPGLALSASWLAEYSLKLLEYMSRCEFPALGQFLPLSYIVVL